MNLMFYIFRYTFELLWNQETESNSWNTDRVKIAKKSS